jgi:hypothetical protein
VFWTSEGRVKVLEFSLARLVTSLLVEVRTFASQTAGALAGTVVGTVGYMASEPARGRVGRHALRHPISG